MKIAKRDIAIVLVIVGLLAVFFSYKFSFSPSREKVDQEKSKQASIQSEIDAIKAREKEADNMRKEMDKWTVEIADAVKPYHSAYLYEDGIMYMDNLEKQVDNENEEEAFGVRIDTYSVGENAAGNEIQGQGCFAGKTYKTGSTGYSFNYDLTGYDQLKHFINYIISEKDGSGVKTLDSMSFNVANDTSNISGSVSLTAYTFSDGDNAYVPQNLEEVETGIESGNIWGEMHLEGEDQE